MVVSTVGSKDIPDRGAASSSSKACQFTPNPYKLLETPEYSLESKLESQRRGKVGVE